MKKLMTVAIAGLLVFSLAGTVLAYDEEEKDIRKKHEAWLEKVMVGRVGQEQTKMNEKRKKNDKEKEERKDVLSPEDEVKQYIAEQMGVKIEDVSIVSVEKYGSVIPERQWDTELYTATVGDYTVEVVYGTMTSFGFGSLGWLEGSEPSKWPITAILSFEIIDGNDKQKGHKPIIESWRGNDFVSQLTKEQAKELAKFQKKYDLTIFEGNSKSNDLIVLSEEGEQVCQVYTFLNENWADQLIQAISDYFGMAPKELQENSEVLQRKVVEMEIPLKENGKNYTFSGQMADQPKEAVPLQKKQ